MSMVERIERATSPAQHAVSPPTHRSNAAATMDDLDEIERVDRRDRNEQSGCACRQLAQAGVVVHLIPDGQRRWNGRRLDDGRSDEGRLLRWRDTTAGAARHD
jgi:hypothetical protein